MLSMFKIRKIEDKKPRKLIPWEKILLSTLKICRPLIGIVSDWRIRKEEEKRRLKRIRALKRILAICISVLIVLVIGLAVLQAFFSIRILSFGRITSVTGTPPPSDENGFTNILLLGQGDSGHDGKDLTDTAIVLSLDPNKTKSAVMLSLPRDLYLLHTEKMGKGKLNTFYRDYKGYLKYMKKMDSDSASGEAIKELGAEIGRNLGLNMHGTIKIDFTAFEQAVDAIGGMDIEVPYDIADNEYPDENYGFEPFKISKGMNHLNGKTAPKYARSRSTTSDFDRSARQQQLIKELGRKAKEEGLHKKPGIVIDFLKIYKNNVETTLSMRELIGLASMASEIEPKNVISMQLNDRNAIFDGLIEPGGFLYAPPRDLFEGASVLLPVSIPEFPVTWKQITALKKLLFDQRRHYLDKPVISVLNAGAPSGHARKLATEMARYGFTVDVVENASIPKQDDSFVSVKPGANAEAEFFASLIGISVKPAPSELSESQMRQITYILGKDYSYKPLQSFILSE